jgi:AcrR family transcriptional regulator
MRRIDSKNKGTESRRRDIIMAALACFSQKNVSETRMEDIRGMSGASIGSIYHHFKSRSKLAAAVYIEGIRDYQDGVLAVIEKNPDARGGVIAIVSFHLTWARDHPDWGRFLFQRRHAAFMDETEAEFAALNRRFFDGVSTWVMRHMKSGEFRKTSPGVFISLLLGPCQEYTRLFLFENAVTDIDVAISEIGEAVWRSLKGGMESKTN